MTECQAGTWDPRSILALLARSYYNGSGWIEFASTSSTEKGGQTVTEHPLVAQLRFTRSEFRRCLDEMWQT